MSDNYQQHFGNLKKPTLLTYEQLLEDAQPFFDDADVFERFATVLEDMPMWASIDMTMTEIAERRFGHQSFWVIVKTTEQLPLD